MRRLVGSKAVGDAFGRKRVGMRNRATCYMSVGAKFGGKCGAERSTDTDVDTSRVRSITLSLRCVGRCTIDRDGLDTGRTCLLRRYLI